MTAPSSLPTSLKDRILEWRDLYAHRSYMLARHAMQGATAENPHSAEAFFLLGQTEMALRDPRKAQEAFEKARDLLTNNPTQKFTFRELKRIPEALPRILNGLRQHTLAVGPETWDEWLESPESIDSPLTRIARIAATPLGRTQPLLSYDEKSPIGTKREAAAKTGILYGMLEPVSIKVETMRDLLGKDLDLHIDPSRVSLRDPSIQIRTIDLAETGQKLQASAVSPGSLIQDVGPVAADVGPVTGAPVPHYQSASEHSSIVAEPQGIAPHPAERDPWAVWESDVEQLIRRGIRGEAFERIDQALAKYPDSSRLHELRAQAFERFNEQEKAARAYLETYKHAQNAGAEQRAQRAFRSAYQLARENADILLDLAALAASFGSVGLALSTAQLAADIYRRRNDRTSLFQVIERALGWAPDDTALKNEYMRLKNDLAGRALDGLQKTHAGQKFEAIKSRLEDWAGPDEGPSPTNPEHPAQREGLIEIAPESEPWARVTPPKRRGPSAQQAHPAAQPVKIAPPNRSQYEQSPSLEELRKRALNTQIPDKDSAGSPLDGNTNGFLIILGIFAGLLTLPTGWIFPGIVGAFIAHGIGKQSEDAAKLANTIRGLCIGLIVYGMIF